MGLLRAYSEALQKAGRTAKVGATAFGSGVLAVGDYLGTRINIAGHPLESVYDHLMAKQSIALSKEYSIEALEELKSTLQQNAGMTPGGVFNAQAKAAFDILERDKAKDESVFNSVVCPNDTSPTKRGLADILKAPAAKPPIDAAAIADNKKRADDAKAIQNRIEKALAVDAGTDAAPGSDYKFAQAKEDYALSILAFDRLCDEVPYKLSALALADCLSLTINDAHTAIDEQQKRERARLKAELTPDFFDKLSKASGLPPLSMPEQDKYKNDMLAALEKSQDDQIKEFKKHTDAAKIKLFNAVNRRVDEIAFMQMIRKNDWESRQEIDRIVALKQGQGNSMSLTFTGTSNPNEDDIDLSVVSLRDLAFFTTNTGSKIDLDHSDPDHSTFRLTLPNRILAPMYYNSPKDKIFTDMLAMAQGVRISSPGRSIIMTMKFDDPDTMKERARTAYLACMQAGHDEANIEIRDNKGKKIENMQALFDDAPDDATKLSVARQNAQAQKNKITAGKITDKSAPGSTDRLKAQAVIKQKNQEIKTSGLEVVNDKGLASTKTAQEVRDALMAEADKENATPAPK